MLAVAVLLLVSQHSLSAKAMAGHHQARKFDVALSAGEGGAGHSSQPSGMAQSVFPPDDATWQKDGPPGTPPKVVDCHCACAAKYALVAAAVSPCQ